MRAKSALSPQLAQPRHLPRLFASLYEGGLRCFWGTEMQYYLTAIELIAHTYFWGFGLALLALPRIWRRWAWVFAPGFGFALQSAVVWAGVHTSLAGTNVYAWGSELIPLGLLIVAAWRRPRPLSWGWSEILLVAVLAGWWIISPMTKSGAQLTSMSLGSCDHADYAAGARVFQEFSRDDRTGFLGLPEVTKVRSADYFFDFWVRLNHFTPSALIAHHASILGRPAFRLVSVMGAAILLLNLPVVFFIGRLTVGLRGWRGIGLVWLYVFSPLSIYAVYHGQLGQLFAAQGIALLTVAVFGAGRSVQRGRTAWPFLGLMVAAVWLLAGSYNFILPVCLAPGGAWLLVQFWRRRDWKKLGHVLAVIAVAFAVCVGLFWGRFDGLIERFSLFNQYNFGWAVPLFSPEGILGMLRDTSLSSWPVMVRVSLSAVVVGLWIGGLVMFARRQQSRALASLALVLPVMLGWGILAWETQVRANASYDAYKLISVFLPGILAGLLCWMAAARGRGLIAQSAAAVLVGMIVVANVRAGANFRAQMNHPPLVVNRALVELGRLEKDPEITSLNMVVEDYWSRIWANAFLLRKAQYFAIHTYEGRLNTALKGEWNLSDSLLHAVPWGKDDFRLVNERFFLVRASAPGLVKASFSEGWYREESLGKNRWRWSGGAGQIQLVNPMDGPIRSRLRLTVQSYRSRELTVRLDAQVLATRVLDGTTEVLDIENVLLPPGRSVLVLAGEGISPGGGDGRRLAFALYGLELRALAVEP